MDSIWEVVHERDAGDAAHVSEPAAADRPGQANSAASASPERPQLPAANRPENERSHQDLSAAEMDIVGVLGQDGELVIRTASTPEEDEASKREREQQQQISRARLVANATFQRQRESVLLRNPSLTKQVNFGSTDPNPALHLLDLHFKRLHLAYLISYRPAIMDSLITNGPYCNMLLLTARDQFYASFRLALVDHIDQPSVPTAVGLLLCSAALVSSGRLSASWVTSGIAYRIILDLGCHFVVDSPRYNLLYEMILLTDVELGMRKRLYWGGYLIDATQTTQDARGPIESDLRRWHIMRPKHLCFNPKADKEPTPLLHQLTPLTTYHTLIILRHRPFLANSHLSTHIGTDERAAAVQASIEAAFEIYHLLRRYEFLPQAALSWARPVRSHTVAFSLSATPFCYKFQKGAENGLLSTSPARDSLGPSRHA
ncbi:hypothetical protein BDV12DRAFT_204609 [Aspergillus spectabilis]